MSNSELIAYFSDFVTPERLERFEQVLAQRTRYITVVLEDIYQQHNASAVLRTCDCFGIQDIHVIEKRNNFSVNDNIALGASKWLSIHKYRESEGVPAAAAVVSKLKKDGYRIVATIPDGKAVSLEEFDLSQGKVALLFGTELKGLTGELMKRADEFLLVPMVGFTESFNISVTAGIVLHHLTHTLRHSTLNWRVAEEEKESLKLEWLRITIRNSELVEKRFFHRK